MATATSTASSATLRRLHYFENTGTAIAPAFTARTGVANPFDGVDVGTFSAPSFADLDGDGDLDAVVGEGDGNLNYFRYTSAPDFAEQTGAANPFNGVDVGFNSTPSFADLDGDGDLDAVVGAQDGTLNYFENTGTATAPAFTGPANPLNGVNVEASTPSFADLDGDGDLDAVVGEDGGTLNYFENTGSASAPAFTHRAHRRRQSVRRRRCGGPQHAELRRPRRIGDLDAVVGEAYGSLNYFENTGTAIAPAFTARTGAANPFDGVDVGFNSAPSFADLDGDGDLDAVVGALMAPCTISRTPARPARRPSPRAPAPPIRSTASLWGPAAHRASPTSTATATSTPSSGKPTASCTISRTPARALRWWST